MASGYSLLILGRMGLIPHFDGGQSHRHDGYSMEKLGRKTRLVGYSHVVRTTSSLPFTSAVICKADQASKSSK